MKKKGRVTESSGNVFEDMELEDAKELVIKSDLVAAIYRTITARGFKNQREAAVLMGIDQPRDGMRRPLRPTGKINCRF